ncbi:extracellular solute-binding protein [Streptomyces sp. NPDC088789]|uniref:extracellular solute-binding protein n=1 Tax=Streptomyces sp. NPDC088789 TaxID=3365899 RepID=UPI00380546DC
MRRRLLALVCVSASLVSGCGLLPGSDGERRTVTVWLMKDSASQDFLDRFTEEFESEHSDLKLDIKIQQWTGIGPKVEGALEADGKEEGAPDVIEVGNTQVPQYVEGGRLLDLTLESVRDWGSKEWLPGLSEPGQLRSHQYGIPWYAANRVVIYRKDLFEEAGIDKLPKNRDEWLTATEKLNTEGNQGIYLAGQDWYTLAGFIWDEDGELATLNGAVWEGSLGSAEALAGMEFYEQMQGLGDGPVDADEQNPPLTDVFAKGRVAQIIAVPGNAQAILKANPELKDQLGFFPVPGKTADKPGAVLTGGSDLIIPRHTDESDGAIAVIEALAGAKWNQELARTMNYVPNKAKLAGALSGDEGAAAMAEGAVQGRATPISPEWARVEADNPIKDYMTKVLTGADPATEAKKASDKITEALSLS